MEPVAGCLPKNLRSMMSFDRVTVYNEDIQKDKETK